VEAKILILRLLRHEFHHLNISCIFASHLPSSNNLAEAKILLLRLLCHEFHHLNTLALFSKSHDRSPILHNLAEAEILVLSLRTISETLASKSSLECFFSLKICVALVYSIVLYM
jgi:hypothetical protein